MSGAKKLIMTTFKIEENLLKAVRMKCIKEGVTMNRVIVAYLSAWLNSDEKK